MSNDTLLSQLDQDAKNLKPALDVGFSLERLRNNKDFNKVIVDGYLKQEALRLVHLKADPNMQDPVKQAAVVRDIDAIGALAQYLMILDRDYAIAKSQMNHIEETRTEVLNEGA